MGNARLSSSARLAYWWLRATSRDGYSYETNRELGERIGIAEDAVSLIARELAEAKLVRREAAGRGAGVCKRWAILGATIAFLTSAPAPSDARSAHNQASEFHRSLIKTQKRRRRRVTAAA
jgi:DNA-binding Lrp family transcriptional regulator